MANSAKLARRHRLKCFKRLLRLRPRLDVEIANTDEAELLAKTVPFRAMRRQWGRCRREVHAQRGIPDEPQGRAHPRRRLYGE